MLILFIRVVFVILAVFVGHAAGLNLMGEDFPWWQGPMLGFAIAVTLIAAEHAFRRRFTRTLAAFLLGIGAGLLFSLLLLAVIDLAVQSHEIKENLDVPLALVTTYLVLVMVLHNADRFRVVVPFIEFRPDRLEEGVMVLDAAALADGRLLGLARSGVLDGRVLVPRTTIRHCETLAASDDMGPRVRGQRALETMTELGRILSTSLSVDHTDLPQAGTPNEAIIGLARLHGARVVSGDRDLVARARAEHLRVLHLQELVDHLAPVLRTGSDLEVTIEKTGEGRDQGIAYLDDGSMVVVEGGRAHLGQRVRITVVRLHHSSAGRMIFADLATKDT